MQIPVCLIRWPVVQRRMRTLFIRGYSDKLRTMQKSIGEECQKQVIQPPESQGRSKRSKVAQAQSPIALRERDVLGVHQQKWLFTQG
jgi:hypothetical protein